MKKANPLSWVHPFLEAMRGTIRFDENHQIIAGYAQKTSVLGCWVQWHDGERVQIFPKAAAMGEIWLPPWMKRQATVRP